MPAYACKKKGFTVEVTNTGLGVASGVVLDDPLPAGSGPGVPVSVDGSTGTPAKFVLSGSQVSQTMSWASRSSPLFPYTTLFRSATTSKTECGTYDNTATLTTGNANNPDPASAE